MDFRNSLFFALPSSHFSTLSIVFVWWIICPTDRHSRDKKNGVEFGFFSMLFLFYRKSFIITMMISGETMNGSNVMMRQIHFFFQWLVNAEQKKNCAKDFCEENFDLRKTFWNPDPVKSLFTTLIVRKFLGEIYISRNLWIKWKTLLYEL